MTLKEKQAALAEVINLRGYVVCATRFHEHNIGDTITYFENMEDNTHPFTVIARTTWEDWNAQHKLLERMQGGNWAEIPGLKMFWRLITD